MATANPSRARPNIWTRSGVPLHPEIRKALRAEAALAGTPIPVVLHRILVEALRPRGYVPQLSGEECPS